MDGSHRPEDARSRHQGYSRSSPENYTFPLILRSGVNKQGKNIRYLFNYSNDPKDVKYLYPEAKELISGKTVKSSENLSLAPWEVLIMEEK